MLAGYGFIYEMDKKFFQYIKSEGLADLQLKFQMTMPPFSTGKVKKFQVDNILLAGRAAGLTERLTLVQVVQRHWQVGCWQRGHW